MHGILELRVTFWNSVIIDVDQGSTRLVIIEAMAAFALTHMPFRWASKVFTFILIGLIVPIQMALVPLNIANEFSRPYRYTDRIDTALYRFRSSIRGFGDARIFRTIRQL